MASLANAGEELFLEHSLDINRIATAGVNVQVALSTANPLESGAGLAEPVGANYARVTTNTWDAATGRKSAHTNDIVFPAAGVGGWGTISHWAVFWDESPSDVLMFYGSFATPRAVTQGDVVTIPAGELEIAFVAEDNETSISNYLANEILDHFLKVGDWNVPTTDTVWLGLWAADLSDSSSGSTLGEINETGYARLARTSAQWTSSAQESDFEVVKNATSLTFGPATEDWDGPITDIAVLDAATTGNILYYGQFATAHTINNGDSLTIAGNDLQIRMK